MFSFAGNLESSTRCWLLPFISHQYSEWIPRVVYITVLYICVTLSLTTCLTDGWQGLSLSLRYNWFCFTSTSWLDALPDSSWQLVRFVQIVLRRWAEHVMQHTCVGRSKSVLVGYEGVKLWICSQSLCNKSYMYLWYSLDLQMSFRNVWGFTRKDDIIDTFTPTIHINNTKIPAYL